MIIFINKNHDRLTGRYTCRPYDITETRRETIRFDFNIILLLPDLKLVIKDCIKIVIYSRIIAGQTQCQDSMRLPFRLKLLYGKTLEQFLFPLEIGLESRK